MSASPKTPNSFGVRSLQIRKLRTQLGFGVIGLALLGRFFLAQLVLGGCGLSGVRDFFP